MNRRRWLVLVLLSFAVGVAGCAESTEPTEAHSPFVKTETTSDLDKLKIVNEANAAYAEVAEPDDLEEAGDKAEAIHFVVNYGSSLESPLAMRKVSENTVTCEGEGQRAHWLCTLDDDSYGYEPMKFVVHLVRPPFDHYLTEGSLLRADMKAFQIANRTRIESAWSTYCRDIAKAGEYPSDCLPKMNTGRTGNWCGASRDGDGDGRWCEGR